jgi:alkylation response protein AidB-like acyl-CoA dehydrogenase
MDFRYSDEETAFLKEVQQFIKESMPEGWLGVDPGPEEEANEEVYQLSLRNWRRLGEKHWIGLTYPPKYGGQGSPLMKETVLLQELAYRGCPGCDLALVEADLILQFGTEEQKQRFVPPILRGEVKWAIGMSEPNAGSDTFNVQLSAVEQEDCYVLNGQKIWSSGAQHAQREVVYARTAPEKHRGVSVFLVDLSSPGISIRQIATMTGLRPFCEVFFDNVKVPKEDLLGTKNGGLKILMYAFAAERSSGLYALHNSRRYLEQLIEYCKNTVVGGQSLSQDPAIRTKLGQLVIETEVGIGLGDRLNWTASKGMDTVKASNQMKVYGARCVQHVAQTGQEILGLYGQLNEDSKWVRLGGRFRHAYLSSVAASLLGGTTEVARNHIAGRFGLGLPDA